MRDERRYRDEQGRGIPDGLLIGVLAFLLGMTVMVWTATGLAGLFAKGAWPTRVTFGHTPLAIRSLVARPHDVPGAWPATPEGQLSGYGLFWGLLIGQLMILVVLALFVAGTVARWRAVRRAATTDRPHPRPGSDKPRDGVPPEFRPLESASGAGPVAGATAVDGVPVSGAAAAGGAGPASGATPAAGPGTWPGADPALAPGARPAAAPGAWPGAGAAPMPGATPATAPGATPAAGAWPPAGATPAAAPGAWPASAATPTPAASVEPTATLTPAASTGPAAAPAPPAPTGPGTPLTPADLTAVPTPPTPGTPLAPGIPDTPGIPASPASAQAPPGTAPAPAPSGAPAVPAPRSARGPLLLGAPADRHPLAAAAIQDAEGPALVITSAPQVWAETKDARAKLGPVLLYDPTHRCDTPARTHWNPAAGCTDRATAATRAAALLAPIRPTARLDSAVAETAETLLRSYLHAAAVDGKPFRHVHRWAQGNQVQDAVRILRTSPKAAAGAAGELEAALTSHPERRDVAQELTARALSALFTVHVREACTFNRTDALTLDSFVDEGGTLYVVGEAIEDPKANPGAMPLLTALASSVVEHGRRMADRSPAGRLDPPMTLVLDDVAAVAPLPQLPELLASGADRGLPTLALLRSREQGRSRWPDAELPSL
ncbi:type IV secretory system conjugative DNA transfer family protein [Streptomyces sp. NPDC006552]|uniref:type IV secretory system conjugative DNA transfer family protein n=1 Tax=Streptomyces sp. NPDC006552 TaxID=3157179 RepID=UPI0033B7114B